MLHVHVTGEAAAAEGVTGEWMIRPGAADVAVEPGHGKGDVAVRGAAGDLLLLLMRRVSPGDPGIEVMGDAALLDALLAATAW